MPFNPLPQSVLATLHCWLVPLLSHNDKLSIYMFLLYLCAVRKSKPLKTGKFVGDRGNNLFTWFKLKKGEYTKKKTQLNDILNRVSVTSLCSWICVSSWMQPDSAGPEGLRKRSQVAELSAQLIPQGALGVSTLSECCQQQPLLILLPLSRATAESCWVWIWRGPRGPETSFCFTVNRIAQVS